MKRRPGSHKARKQARTRQPHNRKQNAHKHNYHAWKRSYLYSPYWASRVQSSTAGMGAVPQIQRTSAQAHQLVGVRTQTACRRSSGTTRKCPSCCCHSILREQGLPSPFQVVPFLGVINACSRPENTEQPQKGAIYLGTSQGRPSLQGAAGSWSVKKSAQGLRLGTGLSIHDGPLLRM